MTDRKLTIRPEGRENVFGALPWILALPKATTQNHPCQGQVLRRSTYRPCKRQARWLYADLTGQVHYVCFSHVHTGLLERDDEQERLEKWKRQVNYYGFDNEAVISEEVS